MTEHKEYSRYRIDQIAKELGGKWYHQIVTDRQSEYKRIVIEYGAKRKGEDF